LAPNCPRDNGPPRLRVKALLLQTGDRVRYARAAGVKRLSPALSLHHELLLGSDDAAGRQPDQIDARGQGSDVEFHV